MAPTVRRLIVRAVPYRLRARLRAWRYGRVSRTNLDVFVAHAGSWLRRTPDTVRVLAPPPRRNAAAGSRTAGEPRAAGLAASIVDRGLCEAAVAGPARPARPWDLRGDPVVEAQGVALRADLDVAGTDPGAVYDRLVAAGLRVGVVPTAASPRPGPRRDAIRPPSAVVFSLVPLHDLGGGGRPAQLTLALLSLGFHVTHVHAHGAAGSDHGVRFLHSELEQVWSWDFDPATLLGRAGNRAVAVVAAPAPELTAPARALHEAGYRLVYDVIDDWGGQGLGWDWHDPGREADLARAADAVTASAPSLAQRFDATLVSNGVNEGIFSAPIPGRPPELPEGMIVGYHGTLSGAWIDWDAIRAVAEGIPGTVVLVGDPPPGRPDLPANVALVGSRPQVDLLPLVGHFDAGIVPFAVSPTTHAVSPLKVYEYLAAGVPVAAPPLQAIRDLDGVHTADDLAAAVVRALNAPRPDRHAALAAHGWRRRTHDMLAAVGVDLPEHAGEACRILVRPTIHWAPEERTG